MSDGVRILDDSANRALAYLGENLLRDQELLGLGHSGRLLIHHRTAAGKDMHGQAFAPYSTESIYMPVAKRPAGYPQPTGGRATKSGKSMYFDSGYKAYKAAGWSSTVTLSVSNAMLMDIQVRKAGEGTVELYWSARSSAAKAHGHQTGANHLPKREFFGFTQANAQQIEKDLADHIAAVASKAQGMG